MAKPLPQMTQTLLPCSSGRRSSASNSPEFEFWMVRNPSFPQPDLLSADELFVDGILLPLHLRHIHSNHYSDNPPDGSRPHPTISETNSTTRNPDPPPEPEPESGPSAGTDSSTAPPAGLSASKRWRDIFKKSDRKNSNENRNSCVEKEKKKERKVTGAGAGASSAELNINIWPFARSRSAGNSGNRPKMVPGAAVTRKVSSAPCSRSNSAGESKSRKWPSSPSRGGVHLGRSSPVWQVRRGCPGGNAEKGLPNEARRKKTAAAAPHVPVPGGGVGTKARVLNVNVPTCTGYRQRFSCRSDQNSTINVAAVGSGESGSGDGARGGNLFNLRGLFTKKVF